MCKKLLLERSKNSKNMKMKVYRDLQPPEMLLLGGGPSNTDPKVLKALSLPIVEHLDPYFLEVMNETVELLRYTFQTSNRITLPISGTGSAGMESAICNLVEEGDEVVVCINGYFGERISEMVSRYGGNCIKVKAEWGKIVQAEAVEEALEKSNAKVVAVVHAETSTGILQPLRDIARIVQKHDAYLLVDAVTSLSGCEVDVDGWGIDVCYSASQKCLSCPPGLAPITVSERAMRQIVNRARKVQSWYFDLSLIEEYWLYRKYHHTAPISLIYALRESLRLLQQEGLERRWERHRINSAALIRGVEALGLEMYADEGHRCPCLNAISIPEGIRDENVRRTLREGFNITVGGGLGQLQGKIWRVGLMGVNSQKGNIIQFLEAFERALKKEGYISDLGVGVAAAMETLS